jgi:hypothetical protein
MVLEGKNNPVQINYQNFTVEYSEFAEKTYSKNNPKNTKYSNNNRLKYFL